MKKLVLMMCAVFALSFVSCGNKTAGTANQNDSDTTVVDSVAVDSVSADSVK